MSILNKIESEFGFQYPYIYKNLYQSGMLNWKLKFSILNKNPPLLFFPEKGSNVDFELLELDEVISDLRDRDSFLRLCFDSYKFVSFGMTGRGDRYVFCYDIMDEDVVIGVAERGIGCTILAKNFEDFIFRMLLEFAVYIDLTECPEEDFRQALLSMLKTHQPYIKKEQHEFLLSVYQRPLTRFILDEKVSSIQEEYNGFISYEEFDDILIKLIGFGRLNEVLEQSEVVFKYPKIKTDEKEVINE